jgi:hypothetical protein
LFGIPLLSDVAQICVIILLILGNRFSHWRGLQVFQLCAREFLTTADFQVMRRLK